MTAENRTNANNFFSFDAALAELDRLKFSYSSMAEQLPQGSYLREICMNASLGIHARIDYLHDSFRMAFEQRAKT